MLTEAEVLRATSHTAGLIHPDSSSVMLLALCMCEKTTRMITENLALKPTVCQCIILQAHNEVYLFHCTV